MQVIANKTKKNEATSTMEAKDEENILEATNCKAEEEVQVPSKADREFRVNRRSIGMNKLESDYLPSLPCEQRQRCSKGYNWRQKLHNTTGLSTL